jgi:hypothetical protein
MLNIAKFRAPLVRYLLLMRCIVFLPLGCIFLIIPVAILFPSKEQFDGITLFVLISYGVMVPTVFGIHLWYRRDQRLICSHCNRSLLSNWERVITSKKCSFCKEVILTDPEAQKFSPPLTKAEAESLIEEERKFIRRAPWMFTAMFILFGVIWGIATEIVVSLLQECGVIIVEVRQIRAVVSCTLVFIGFMVFRRKLMIVRNILRAGVSCPRCKSWEWVSRGVKLGSCTHCGQQLVRDCEATRRLNTRPEEGAVSDPMNCIPPAGIARTPPMS